VIGGVCRKIKMRKDRRRTLGLGELALGRFGSFNRVGFFAAINRVSCKKPLHLILTPLSLSSLKSVLPTLSSLSCFSFFSDWRKGGGRKSEAAAGELSRRRHRVGAKPFF